MRKEVLFAVIFGIVLGGIILFGINLANKSVDNLSSPNESTPSAIASPTPKATQKTFEISTPQNHAVLSERFTLLSGTATPETDLAIVTEDDDFLIKSSPEGTFSAQINLIPGENILTVTWLLPDHSTKTQSITVIQSSTLPE